MYFSFNGVQCDDLHLTYIPGPTERAPSLPPFDVISTNPTYRHGGYYFGYQIKPREFDVPCYFEDVTSNQIDDMLNWMMPGTKGKLVFSDRPLVYYDAVVTAAPNGEIYQDGQRDGDDLYGGKINFKLTAYEPFGKISVTTSDEENDLGLLPSSILPEMSLDVPATNLVYNPGTFETDCTIKIGGSADSGVTIRNATNGDTCKLLHLMHNPEWIEVNSLNGTIKRSALPDGMYYEIHDYGYIRLAPGEPRTHVPVVCKQDDNEIETTSFFNVTDEGRYIYIDGEWLRIASVKDSHHAIVSKRFAEDKEFDATIVTMNEISVQGSGVTLDKFEVEFTPYVR